MANLTVHASSHAVNRSFHQKSFLLYDILKYLCLIVYAFCELQKLCYVHLFSAPLSPLSPSVEGGDGLSQLTALVKKGEKKAMFSQGMPPQIRRSVSRRISDKLMKMTAYSDSSK